MNKSKKKNKSKKASHTGAAAFKIYIISNQKFIKIIDELIYYLKLEITELVPAPKQGVSCGMADYTFRLKNTPLGTLVVKFYQVEPYSPTAFERVVQRDFLATTIPGSGGSWGSRLYQGEVDNASVLPEAIFNLHRRCAHCNCVRIERAGG